MSRPTTSVLKLRSPRLAGMLRRSGLEVGALETAFCYALEHGGEREIGYQRPKDQSYNPRPARVAQILLKDFEVASRGNGAVRVLAAAMVACSDEPGEFHDLAICELALSALGDDWETDPAAALIAHALHLDYSRHAHRTLALDKEFGAKTERHLAHCRTVSPQVAALFEKVLERYPRRDH